jgi:hypothetical protein
MPKAGPRYLSFVLGISVIMSIGRIWQIRQKAWKHRDWEFNNLIYAEIDGVFIEYSVEIAK